MLTLVLSLRRRFGRMRTMTFRRPFTCLLLLLLMAAGARAAVDGKALMSSIDEHSRSAKIERELKQWKDMGNDPYARTQKNELTKQLHAVKRDEAAAKRRVAACLERVLRMGDINAADRDGRTLLMAVAGTGVDAATAAVLREKPDLSLTDCNGHTALWYEMRGMGRALNTALTQEWQAALKAGKAEEVRLLLECGVSPATPTEKGNPPLGEALESGHAGIVAELLRQDSVSPYPMADGRTLLEVAVTKGSSAAVEYLLSHGADAEEALSSGERPLRYLLRCGAPETVLAFLKGAELGNRAEGDTRVCCLAARYASAETLRALLRTLDKPHEEDAYGNTPLLEAARRGELSLYDAVTDSGSFAWKNSRGETPLMHAALSGNEAMLRRVLETMPAELRTQADAAGRRAEDYAAFLPNPEPIRALLAAPAE